MLNVTICFWQTGYVSRSFMENMNLYELVYSSKGSEVLNLLPSHAPSFFHCLRHLQHLALLMFQIFKLIQRSFLTQFRTYIGDHIFDGLRGWCWTGRSLKSWPLYLSHEEVWGIPVELPLKSEEMRDGLNTISMFLQDVFQNQCLWINMSPALPNPDFLQCYYIHCKLTGGQWDKDLFDFGIRPNTNPVSALHSQAGLIIRNAK